MAPGSDPIAGVPRRTSPLTGLVQGALFAVAASYGLVQVAINGDGWLGVVLGIAGGLVVGMAAGFAMWWFTTFVIDDTELRIDKGIITKSSRRIAFERIQSVDIAEPVVARVVGLAELRIDAAGGKNARTSLRFLPLAEARDLRALLLAKAHGTTVDDHPEQREIITIVKPERLALGTILSLDFLGALLGGVALIVGGLVFGQIVAVLGGFFPMILALGQIIARRVIVQWQFTLTRGDHGLRIERGLLGRTSQSIPFARVQGVLVEEPFVWRRLGWQRLAVDVAGHVGRDEGPRSDATLLPIGDPALCASIVDELVPGVRPDAVEKVRPTRRSWPFAPIGWRYRWVGADDHAFVARSGWIDRTTDVVPHARTQSVAIRQGPLQRLCGVATLEVHTPKGPVNADGRHLDAAVAREQAFAQLARARAARLPDEA